MPDSEIACDWNLASVPGVVVQFDLDGMSGLAT